MSKFDEEYKHQDWIAKFTGSEDEDGWVLTR